jgi:hypothetical protein
MDKNLNFLKILIQPKEGIPKGVLNKTVQNKRKQVLKVTRAKKILTHGR